LPSAEQVRTAVFNKLREVLDPELKLDVVSLGLVYGVSTTEDTASVKLTLTTPGCPLAAEFLADARAKVGSVPGLRKAEVDLTFDPPWSPARLTDEARIALGFAA
jgi:metal-sulfur cluster biosynthetic enzyme